MKNVLQSRGAAFAHDMTMTPLAWLVAYWLRFNLGAIPEPYFTQAWVGLLVIIPLQALVLWYFGLYRGVWRFASMPDLMRILKAVAVGVVLSMTMLFVVTRLHGVPRSVPLLFALLLVVMLSGPRFVYRWVKDHRFQYRPGQRVLIVGAGRAGEMLVRDLLRDPKHVYEPVAFVDDDRAKWGREVHGVRVAGGGEALPRLVADYAIDLIMLAVPSARGADMRRLVEASEATGLPFRTVPSLGDLTSGQVRVSELREVSIEDLLGREPVSLDWDGIRAGLTNKAIVVTGAGGSIGSELCRQIARLEPARLVLLEQGEFNLYSIEMELRHALPGLPLEVHLGDVGDAVAVAWLFARYRPQVVFHAAAYKHVPMLEHQVREAVRNNVLGTRVVAEAADRFGAAQFVLISTDKAVNPANVMGASKRVAELFCQNLNARSATRFITVRFGNVLGSAGSVVPLFRRQIERGGPVTVTHPEMTRYFMTIPEASQLIMQAAVLGAGGEIFVLDMGEPIKIRYLAEQMIRLAGRVPGDDVEIRYTGLRPGEKLFEELFHDQEALAGTAHDKILLARHRAVAWPELVATLDEMAVACARYDEAALSAALQRLVPELECTEEGQTPAQAN